MLGDVSGRGEDKSRPPDSPDQHYHHQAEGRHFGLQSVEFLTSGSRGQPAQLLKTAAPSRRSVRGNIEADETLGGRGKSASPIRWIALFLIYRRPIGK